MRGDIEQQFLVQLWFTGMDDGEISIPKAYEKTLMQVYKDPPELY